MRDCSVTKACGDISFVFGLACLIRPIAAFVMPLLVFVACCLVAGLAIIRIKNTLLRSVLAFLPGLCFLFASSVFHYVALGVALLYFVFCMAKGEVSMEIWTYRSIFIALVCANVFILLILLISGLNISAMFVFAFLFIVFGVLTLRKMRMGANMSVKWNLTNLGGFLVPTFAAIGASVVVYYFCVGILKLLGLLIKPYSVQPDKPVYGSGHLDHTPAASTLINYVSDESTLTESVEDTFTALKKALVEDPDLKILKYIILGVIAIVAFVLVFKYLHVSKKKDEKQIEYEEALYENTNEARRKRSSKKSVASSNSSRIRKIYREYMYFVSGKGVSFSKSTTSQDVIEKSTEIGVIDSEQSRLREIYLKARYSKSEISPQDVQFAQDLLDKIKQENKQESESST